MQAKRTQFTDKVLKLPGGTEDNDLWYYAMQAAEAQGVSVVICTVWVPTQAERERIAKGENIRLIVWGVRHPPVSMDLTDERVMGVDVG